MWLPFGLVLMITGALSSTPSKFTGLECQILDPDYFTYSQCKLKVLGRGIIGLNVHARMYQGPLKNAKVNLSLFRKFSGYRPFMFNTTFDFCKLMATSNQKLSFKKIIFDVLSKNSNMNHSCPYDHDFIVRDLVFKPEYFEFLPLPTGEYRLQIMAATNNQWKTSIKVNILIIED